MKKSRETNDCLVHEYFFNLLSEEVLNIRDEKGLIYLLSLSY